MSEIYVGGKFAANVSKEFIDDYIIAYHNLFPHKKITIDKQEVFFLTNGQMIIA